MCGEWVRLLPSIIHAQQRRININLHSRCRMSLEDAVNGLATHDDIISAGIPLTTLSAVRSTLGGMFKERGR